MKRKLFPLTLLTLLLVVWLTLIAPRLYANAPLRHGSTLATNFNTATLNSLHGFAANDPPTINALAPAWVQTDFGLYLMGFDFGDTKLVLNMTNLDALPSGADVFTLTTHKSYDRFWMVGYNEPDLAGYTPAQTAARITAQGNLILSVAPNARLSIASLSQYRPLFRRNYFWKVWDLLPPNIRSKIRAVNIHFYTQAEMLPDAMTFSESPITEHLTLTRAAMVAHGVGDLKLFVTEIGLARTPYTEAHMSEVNNYPNVIAAATVGLADRWAIYKQLAMSADDPYFTLMPYTPYGALTAQGETFLSLQ